jgi:hypothetical protein
LTDASFHLLVRDGATLLDVTLGLTHGGVTVIDVIWKPVDRLENLLFNAHGSMLAKPKAIRNGHLAAADVYATISSSVQPLQRGDSSAKP